MTSPKTMIGGGGAGLLAGSVVFVALGLLFAEGAAVWHLFSGGGLPADPRAAWSGSVLYLVAAGSALVCFRWLFQHRGARSFLGCAVVSSLLVQLIAIALAGRQWNWTGDAALFSHTLDRLAAAGYSADALRDLSRYYDYPIWPKRALPFYYAIRIAAGNRFMVAIQSFQALAVSLSLVFTWRMVRLSFGRRTAFWATGLQALMPFRWFICLDLNHYVLGGLYWLAASWMLVEWGHGPPHARRKWGLAAGLAFLFLLMKLEGGLDSLYLAFAFLALLLQWAGGRFNAQTALRAGAAWIVVPWLFAGCLLWPLHSRLDAANQHRLSSGLVGFAARGWMPETGGEYSATYEQIDWLTPVPDKKRTQLSILASQALYNPRALLVRLLPIKMARFFLLGYASGAEEMLHANGAGSAALWAKGARIAFLLAVLPLLIWGSLLLLPRLRRLRCAVLVLPAAGYCAAIVLMGEVSPRYSYHVQPFLFALGALPLAYSPARRGAAVRRGIRLALRGALVLGIGWASVCAALAFARPALARWAMLDLRLATVADNVPQAISPTLAPFEIRLPPQADSPVWGTLRLPVPDDGAATFTCYLLPQAGLSASHGTPCVLRRRTAAGWQEETLRLPTRLTLTLRPGDARAFELRAPAAPAPFPLMVGYADLDVRP